MCIRHVQLQCYCSVVLYAPSLLFSKLTHLYIIIEVSQTKQCSIMMIYPRSCFKERAHSHITNVLVTATRMREWRAPPSHTRSSTGPVRGVDIILCLLSFVLRKQSKERRRIVLSKRCTRPLLLGRERIVHGSTRIYRGKQRERERERSKSLSRFVCDGASCDGPGAVISYSHGERERESCVWCVGQGWWLE